MASFRHCIHSTPSDVSRLVCGVCREGEQLPQASSGQADSQGSMTDEDGNASGSWLVDDDDGGVNAVEGNNSKNSINLTHSINNHFVNYSFDV